MLLLAALLFSAGWQLDAQAASRSVCVCTSCSSLIIIGRLLRGFRLLLRCLLLQLALHLLLLLHQLLHLGSALRSLGGKPVWACQLSGQVPGWRVARTGKLQRQVSGDGRLTSRQGCLGSKQPHLILLILPTKAQQRSKLQHITQPPPGGHSVVTAAAAATAAGCSGSGRVRVAPKQDALQQLMLVRQRRQLRRQQ
jgi:hypothetical protein